MTLPKTSEHFAIVSPFVGLTRKQWHELYEGLLLSLNSMRGNFAPQASPADAPNAKLPLLLHPYTDEPANGT